MCTSRCADQHLSQLSYFRINTKLRSVCSRHDNSFPLLKRDGARNEPNDSATRAYHCDTEEDSARGSENGFALFAPRPDVENRARRVEHCGEQHKFQTARIDQEDRIDDGEPSDDQVSPSFLGTYRVGFA